MQASGNLLQASSSLLHHKSAAVRKANIDCIVGMQMKLGSDGIAELKAKMSSAQIKLLQIFHESALRKQQK